MRNPFAFELLNSFWQGKEVLANGFSLVFWHSISVDMQDKEKENSLLLKNHWWVNKIGPIIGFNQYLI